MLSNSYTSYTIHESFSHFLMKKPQLPFTIFLPDQLIGFNYKGFSPFLLYTLRFDNSGLFNSDNEAKFNYCFSGTFVIHRVCRWGISHFLRLLISVMGLLS